MKKFIVSCPSCQKDNIVIIEKDDLYIAAKNWVDNVHPTITKVKAEEDPLTEKKKPVEPNPEATDVPANKLSRSKAGLAREVKRLQAEGKNFNEIAIELKISPIMAEKLSEQDG